MLFVKIHYFRCVCVLHVRGVYSQDPPPSVETVFFAHVLCAPAFHKYALPTCTGDPAPGCFFAICGMLRYFFRDRILSFSLKPKVDAMQALLEERAEEDRAGEREKKGEQGLWLQPPSHAQGIQQPAAGHCATTMAPASPSPPILMHFDNQNWRFQPDVKMSQAFSTTRLHNASSAHRKCCASWTCPPLRVSVSTVRTTFIRLIYFIFIAPALFPVNFPSAPRRGRSRKKQRGRRRSRGRQRNRP